MISYVPEMLYINIILGAYYFNLIHDGMKMICTVKTKNFQLAKGYC